MKHQDIDPTLRAAEPLLENLDDGFSPPGQAGAQPAQEDEDGQPPALSPKSEF